MLTLVKITIRSAPCGLNSSRSKLHHLRNYSFTANQKKKSQPEIPKTNEIISEWDQFSEYYAQRVERNVSLANLTLLNMLKIQEANKIIETACGSG
jgi:hypothetical protein